MADLPKLTCCGRPMNPMRAGTGTPARGSDELWCDTCGLTVTVGGGLPLTTEERGTAESAATDAERRYRAHERGLRAATRELDAAVAKADVEWADPLKLYRSGDGPPTQVVGLGEFVPTPYRATPSTERYVRASVDIDGGSVEVGMQYERGDGFDLARLREQLRATVRRSAREALRGGALTEQNADALTEGIELMIRAVLPDGHGWFVEVWNAQEALTQVYAPCGMPRVH